MTSASDNHRQDIDGLRGLAVLGVLLFHGGFSILPGGFVGVDVFFVISGYLIGGIVLAQTQTGRFQAGRFFVSRILRIVPALLVVIAVTMLAGCVLMTATSLRFLGRDAASAALFLSNIHFWRSIDYFSPLAGLQPLLHTWSLGVEGQFYLVIPLLIAALRTWRRGATSPVLVFLFGLSLAACVWVTAVSPTTAFFLSPFRAWEFLAGCLVATGIARLPSQRAREGAMIVGLLLILGPMATYTETMSFPGIAAAAPVLGAALVIMAGEQATRTGRVLAFAPLAWIGLISYSLYLWHMPMLAFLRHVRLAPPTTLDVLGCLVLSVALSALSWRFVEQPFRSGRLRRLPAWRVIAGAGAIALVVAAAGVTLNRSDAALGAITRVDAPWGMDVDREIRDVYRDHCLSDSGAQFAPSCLVGDKTGEPDFVLWGDSHAEALVPVLEEAARAAGRWGYLVGAWNCPPVPGVATSENKECAAVNAAFRRYVLDTPSIRTVILASYWAGHLSGSRLDGRRYARISPAAGEAGSNEQALARALDAAVREFQAAGKTVVLVGPVPEQFFLVPQGMHLKARGLVGTLPTRTVGDGPWTREDGALKFLGGVSERTGAPVVDILPPLCPDGRCLFELGGYPAYRDEAHLVVRGAKLLGEQAARILGH